MDARYQMARARYRLWEYDARADIETVLKLDPHYADAYLLMGNWYADLKEDYGQAIPWYAKYIAMRPDDPEGRRRLSVAYLKVKDYGRVLETLSGFVQAHPDAVEVMPIVAQACVKQEKLDMALGFYQSYLSKIDPKERMLYEDIRLIASEEEAAEYARTPGAEQEAFLRRFWNGRDPDLSTPVNERLMEHCRRVWYSRQSFSGGRQPWDRRGEVYVRFGEPDFQTSSRMLNTSQSLAVQRVKERMALDIYGTEAIGETYLGPVFPVRSLAQDKGLGFSAPDEHPEYYIGPETDQASRFARYAPMRVAARAIAVSPDFYAPEYDVAPFNFYFDLADFRGRDGRSALEVYYGVPRAAARYVPAEDVTRLVVERQAALIPTASDTVYRAAGELVYEAPGNQGSEGAFVPDVVRLEVPAGTYRLEVRTRDRMTGRLGLYRKDIQVDAYGGKRLGVSDLELAWRVSEGQLRDKFSKGELRVIPMPTRTYRKGQNVFTYYEIYNLKPDGEGQTKYQVEYVIGQRERGILSRLVGTFAGKREEVTVGYEGRGFREMEAAYKEIDLKVFEPGRYYLKVVVTDLNSGETAAKEASFGVVE
ncbi:MAG: hypothetical protein A3F84_29685 [Candidatus Handelsmanbacteria bacterium RIFCSPLOWO2_12_FULL_64_10]|uniref:Uncharacterized protein n=1 Tax=Handelsmanbacteria sp. (strain RIFCSPLOWO2_12_FULL_64_10) TaxID=1817868 RepID=A0A1F6D255_HANXR|nr:MAG: hypothetical protein A3F84_29685 [Candidatus Handelsmanbacteria bacterium RIFCSPLOWO2_12_FULL_64_10]